MRLLTSFIPLLAFILGGCSPSFRSEESRCIKTVLVSSLSQMPLSHFIKGDSRMLTVSSFKAGCGGSSPDLSGGYDDIGLNVTLKIPDARNLKGKITEVEVPLFIALLDRQDNVLDRQDETLKIKVSDYAFSQVYKITYHLPKGIDPTSPSHKILVGFNGAAIKDLPSCSIAQLFVKKKLNKSLKNKNAKKKKLNKSLKKKRIKKVKPKKRRVKTKKVRQWCQQR